MRHGCIGVRQFVPTISEDGKVVGNWRSDGSSTVTAQ